MNVRRTAAFAAVFLLWGGSYFAIRIVVQTIPPVLAAALRYCASGLLLLLLGFLLHRRATPTARQLRNCAVSGTGLLFLVYAPVFWAETRLASWIVAVLSSTSFLWTYLGESLILRTQRFRPWMLPLFVIGLAGVFCISRPASSGDHMPSFVAIAAVLFSSFSWSMSAIALKRIELPQSYLQTAGFQMVFASVLLCALSSVLSEWRQLPSLSSIQRPPVVWSMLYLVVGGSTVAFAAFHWLIRREPASLVASSSYVNPIVAMLLGLGIGHERCSPRQLVGAAAILASVVVAWLVFSRTGEIQSHLAGENSPHSGRMLDAAEHPVG